MKISKDIINDLLPLYFSEVCSTVTKQLVKDYLRSHPDFEIEVNKFTQNPIPESLPDLPVNEIELKSQKRTRRLPY